MFAPLEDSGGEAAEAVRRKKILDALRNLHEKGEIRLPPEVLTLTEKYELNQMVSFLVQLYESGDEEFKAWVRVQFKRAFPELEEFMQKKKPISRKFPQSSKVGYKYKPGNIVPRQTPQGIL